MTATAQLSDVTGAVVATSVTVLTVTGGANAAVIPLQPPDVGYYSVALSFAGGDAPLAATYATSVGVLNALTSIQAAEPPDQSEFGVNTHFDQGQGDPIVTSELIRLAGIRWIRDTLGWPGVEQGAGVYAISPGDLTAFATLNDAGVNVLGCLTYHNPLYAAGSAQEAVAYGKYAQYVAAALPHTVQAFELWNEPQQSGGLTPAQYVPVLRSGYAGVKAGNSAATVVGIGGGSPGGFSGDYIVAIEAADAGGSQDAFSIHPYVTPWNVDTGYPAAGAPAPLANLTNANALTLGFASVIQSALDEPTAPGIWITETGWPTNDAGPLSDVGLVGQAQQVARTYALTAGLGALYSRVFLYDFLCDVSNPSPTEANFGVVNQPDYSVRPAYVALATATRAIDGRPLIRRIADPTDDALQIFVFGPTTAPVIAAWASEVGPRQEIDAGDSIAALAMAGGNPTLSVPVSFTIAGASATVHDWQDRQTSVAASNGAIAVQLSPWPLFIEGVGDAAGIALSAAP